MDVDVLEDWRSAVVRTKWAAQAQCCRPMAEVDEIHEGPRTFPVVPGRC